MAPSTQHDLRTQVLENLLERVRRDEYPSPTMLDMIEDLLRDDEVDGYTGVLFAKLSDETYPSMDLYRRLWSFV